MLPCTPGKVGYVEELELIMGARACELDAEIVKQFTVDAAGRAWSRGVAALATNTEHFTLRTQGQGERDFELEARAS